MHNVCRQGGIPFEVKNSRPSRKLKKALKEGEDILSGKIKTKSYDSVDDLLKDLDNEK